MRTITTLALALALAACGDDSPSSPASPTEGIATLGPCDELAGMPTDEVTDTAMCTTADGQFELLAFAFHDCTDGRRLSWNDRGYGYTGDAWQAHARPDGQLVPPDADTSACLTP